MLTEREAHMVLAAYGIPTVETRVAANSEEAEAVASDLLSPHTQVDQLVVKILSKDNSHKTDLGGIRLGLLSSQQVADAAFEMQGLITAQRPDARIDKFVIQPMIPMHNAYELIAGLSLDRVFGPVLMIGAVDTSVEIVTDKSLALPPLNDTLAANMIDQTRISRLIETYRDRPAADRAAILDVLMKLSNLSASMPEIVELDISPLLAKEDGVIALEARIRVEPAPVHRQGDNPRFAIRPYPKQWDQMIDTPEGGLRLGPIRPSDKATYPAFIEKLSKQDIRFRFFGFFSN